MHESAYNIDQIAMFGDVCVHARVCVHGKVCVEKNLAVPKLCLDINSSGLVSAARY